VRNRGSVIEVKGAEVEIDPSTLAHTVIKNVDVIPPSLHSSTA